MSVGHIVLCLYLVCAYSGCFVRCLFPRVAYGACSDPVIRAFRWHRIMPGKCKFQSAWLSNDDYKLWVAPDTANPHCLIADLTASADEYAEKAETTADIKKVVKSNSLRKTARAKAEESGKLGEPQRY